MISYHIIAQHMQQLNSYLRYYKSLSLYTSWYSLYVRGYRKLCLFASHQKCFTRHQAGNIIPTQNAERDQSTKYFSLLANPFESICSWLWILKRSERRGHHCRPWNITQHNTTEHPHTHTHLCITTHTLSHVLTTHDLDAIRAKSITLVFVLVCLFSTFYQIFVCLNYEYSTRSAACI